MSDSKLTVRVPRELIENTKHFAALNNTTLTALIEAFLRRIPAGKPLEDAPIVNRLIGSLPEDISPADYRKHLEQKYGG
jgi:hypothetical protein